MCHLGLGWLGAVIPHQAFPRSKAAAMRALEIDESLAEAHCALGYVATFYEWHHEAGRSALTRAIELQPGSADTHLFQAWFQNAIGRHDVADAEMRRAIELDPLSPLCLGNAGYLAVFDRRFDAAEQFARQAFDLDPSYVMARWTLGIALACGRNYEPAIEELEAAVRQWPGVHMMGWLGYACALAGKRARAQDLLTTLEQVPPERAARSTELARILVGLGEHDRALAALADACDAREGPLGYIGSDPSWDVIADDERFMAILKRVGLSRRSRP